MKSTDDLLHTIESPEFSARVNLASDFRTFLRALRSEQAVQDLIFAMADVASRETVAARVATLAGDSPQQDHEHPWDAALAAYLWSLAETDPGLANEAAAPVCRAAHCWWARKMLESLRLPSPTR